MNGLKDLLDQRYGDAPEIPELLEGVEQIRRMAARGSARRFADRPVSPALIDALAAVALAAPTKSDLQQRDIVVIRDPAQRAALNALVADQDWIADAPALLIFCGNNRRQRRLHERRAIPFANDHLDAVINAAADAAIALGAFISAAEAVGLGACPISAIRNRAAEASALLALPDHVFPFAGLGVGWPHFPQPRVSLRLPLRVTMHLDRYQEDGLDAAIDAYDRRRAAAQPMATQRLPEKFPHAPDYGWSEDKARQYSEPERADFGAYLRARGFSTE